MIINWEKARSITGEDPDLYKDLWSMILESMDEKMISIRSALAAADMKETEFAVHKLKGALRNVAAEEACAYLQEMEDAARMGNSVQAAGFMSGVQEIVDQVVSYFESIDVKKMFRAG